MSAAAILQATLKPDGTLELDQKPNLPPGRVYVIVQPLPPTSPRRSLVDVMDEIRQSQRAVPRMIAGRSPGKRWRRMKPARRCRKYE